MKVQLFCILLWLLMQAIVLLFGGVAGGQDLDREDFTVRCLEVIEKDERGVALNYPRAIFYDPFDDETYVVGSGENEIIVFTHDFYPVISAGHGRGLKGVRSGAVTEDNLFFCLGSGAAERNNFLLRYDRALLPVNKVELKGFPGESDFKPERVVVRDGFFYVIGTGNQGLLKFAESGIFIDSIIPHEEVLGVKEEAPIKSLVIDKDGRLFLLSEVMGRVYVYSQSGKLLFKFGIKGGSSGKLSRPRAIALDENMGLVFVVDYMRHAVNVYSLDGKYLFEFGGKGDGRGWFAFPSDICLDGRDRLWVADTFNSRVQVFKVSRLNSANEKVMSKIEGTNEAAVQSGSGAKVEIKENLPKSEIPLRREKIEESNL
ncbi:MAG: hypothetical protein JXR80_05260 [Deltaproteobacteria bacterium]|nr:hypothetical protein [Deltaproteobacteria bacterium]